MTDWIKHTGDTCPVDPETVVEVRMSPIGLCYRRRAGDLYWDLRYWSHYRIITPAKPPDPEMTKPDLITLRLECLKLAVTPELVPLFGAVEKVADSFLHYVLNGSVDKAP